MVKDYMSFRNSIKSDNNISLEESYMLEVLFDYYNTSKGYAYPPYENLMADLKTKRRAKISKLLKSLVAKGYIKIEKDGNKNHYTLLKYLFLVKKKQNSKTTHNANTEEENNLPVDSNGSAPLKGQIYVDEALNSADTGKVVDATGLDKEDAAKLLEVAENDVNKVIKAFEYAKEKGKAVFNYIKWVINNIHVVKEKCVQASCKREVKMNFCDYEQRQYSDEYLDNLEKQLLGWC